MQIKKKITKFISKKNLRNLLLITFLFTFSVLIFIGTKQTLIFINKSSIILKKSITPSNVEIIFHHSNNKELCKDLNFSINEFMENNLINFKPKQFCTQLKKMCPLIKGIEWRAKNLKNSILSIEFAIPLFFINNQFVLCNKHKLIEKIFFDNTLLNAIPKITITNLTETKIDKKLYNFLTSIPKYITDNFNINYINKYEIILNEIKNQNPKHTILIDEENINNIERFKLIDYVINDLENKSPKVGPKIKKWVFDLRFKNLIIAKPASQIT